MLRAKMMKLLLICFLYVFASASFADTYYSGLYIFGDSLSDTGNAASIIGPLPPPFYMNRISNGPVAVDVFADKLGLSAEASLHLVGPAVGGNYAVAGANALGNNPEDLGYQIAAFLANKGYVAPSDALYVVMIGGNDIRSERGELDLEVAKATIDAAAAQVQGAMETLILAGAKSFFLVNSPNIALIPETGLIAESVGDSEMFKRAKKLSNHYRVRLKEIAELLNNQPGVNVTEFDFYKFLNKLVNHAEDYGFTNWTDACFSSISFTFYPDCNYGLNFDKYVFFDEIHPTARSHELIGEAFYKTLTKTAAE